MQLKYYITTIENRVKREFCYRGNFSVKLIPYENFRKCEPKLIVYNPYNPKRMRMEIIIKEPNPSGGEFNWRLFFFGSELIHELIHQIEIETNPNKYKKLASKGTYKPSEDLLVQKLAYRIMIDYMRDIDNKWTRKNHKILQAIYEDWSLLEFD